MKRIKLELNPAIARLVESKEAETTEALFALRPSFHSEALYSRIDCAQSVVLGIEDEISKSQIPSERALLTGLAWRFRSVQSLCASMINIKADRAKPAWCQLIDAQECLETASHFPALSMSIATYRKVTTHLRNLESWLFPAGQIFHSASFILKSQICSICDHDLLDCDHMPGKLYGDRICRRIAELDSIREVSMVEEPHNRRCITERYGEEGSWYYKLDGRTVWDSEATDYTATIIMMTITLPESPFEFPLLDVPSPK